MNAIAEVDQAPNGRDGCVQSLVRAFGLLNQLACLEGGLTACSNSGLGGLERDVEQAPRRGYALDDQEGALGLPCVAAPVLGQGQARAALSISAPLLRMSDARIKYLGDTLRFAARRMTGDFGGAIAA